jgi:hypothetical protein
MPGGFAMKRCFALLLFCGLFALSLASYDGFSKLVSVDPESGKEGEVATAKGENLDKSKIAEILLTDGSKDFKAIITAQAEGEITFKIPKAAAGRYRLMLLTANKASMIEQPVVLTIE